jgi:hypothetical protein
VTFKRHATPYFFSLVFSTLGGFLYAVAVSLLVLELANPYQNSPGQGGFVLHGHWKSLILYFRLHLLAHDSWKLNGILGMIIVDVVAFNSITTGLTRQMNMPFVFFKVCSVLIYGIGCPA